MTSGQDTDMSTGISTSGDGDCRLRTQISHSCLTSVKESRLEGRAHRGTDGEGQEEKGVPGDAASGGKAARDTESDEFDLLGEDLFADVDLEVRRIWGRILRSVLFVSKFVVVWVNLGCFLHTSTLQQICRRHEGRISPPPKKQIMRIMLPGWPA